ncbi:MAG: hypothetical protein HKN56_07010 [Gammaproteobacteria bacterium]|nr:hypothetical protein [Gammaproteobacteria bacterium]NND54703.1 hypothetical protein [Gammaproteobacteria bacterium]
MHRNLISITVLVLGFLASGCVNLKALPSYARSGDIVNIGMAGIKFNTDGMVTLRPSDITATITDSNSAVFNAKVLRTFRAFPDNTSFYAFGALDRSPENGGYGSIEPFDGQWWITVHLVDPATDTPLALAVGDATIALASSLVTDTFGLDGELTQFDVEIISGTVNKQPTDTDFYLYAAFDQQQALTIQPDSLTGISKIGGLQLKLDYDPAALKSGTTRIPHLVPISHAPHINIIQNNVDNGDGTHALIAMVTNPLGFVPNSDYGGTWVIGAGTFKDLNFAVLTDDSNLASYATNYTIDSANSFYVDENGDKLLTINPVLGLNY